eukprot:s988_g11.t1
MVELSQLLTDERMLMEKRPRDEQRDEREPRGPLLGGNFPSLVGLGLIFVTTSADDVERNGQRVVGEMRSTLERLAQRSEELRKAKESGAGRRGRVKPG